MRVFYARRGASKSGAARPNHTIVVIGCGYRPEDLGRSLGCSLGRALQYRRNEVGLVAFVRLPIGRMANRQIALQIRVGAGRVGMGSQVIAEQQVLAQCRMSGGQT